MATQELNPADTPTAEVVGNTFVAQYYTILKQSPELVHKFYHESSFLTRLEFFGGTTVTTLDAIEQKLKSLNYDADITEIKTIDSQDSYDNGVITFVNGCLIGKDGMKKKFIQSFFLAPQENGYYVLNDIFRFMEENDTVHGDNVLQNATTTEVEVEDEEETSVVEDEDVEPTAHVTGDDSALGPQDGDSRKSYAEIVKVMKSIAVSDPGQAASPRNVNAPSPKSSQQLPVAAKVSPTEASGPSVGIASGSSNVDEEVEGFSIHVGNLPLDVTVEQLEEVFKKFGPIKHYGIQLKRNKPRGVCFCFVEFKELSSMQSAVEASPVKIGYRQAVVEEKMSTNRGGGNVRGRGRGRGNFSGGRGYGRSEVKNQWLPRG